LAATGLLFVTLRHSPIITIGGDHQVWFFFHQTTFASRNNLEVKIHNSGTSTAHNVTSEISTLDSDVTVTTSSVAIGDIAGGADAWAQSFVFEIAASEITLGC